MMHPALFLGAAATSAALAVSIMIPSQGLAAFEQKTTAAQLPHALPFDWMETTKRLSSVDSPWFLLEAAREHGFVHRLRIFPPIPFFDPVVVVVGDEALARKILNDKNSTKPFAFYGTLDYAAGAPNIFTANGERWKHVRDATSPAFSKLHVDRMTRICNDRLDDWIDRRLNVLCEAGEAFDPAKEMTSLTIATICEALFDYKISDEEAKHMVEDVEVSLQEYFLKQSRNPLRKMFGMFFARDEILRAQQANCNGQALGKKMLSTYRHNHPVATTMISSSSGTIIDLIVKNQNYHNDKERVADIMALLVGGFDATAYSIAWTLRELARHPHEMEHVRKELKSLATERKRLNSRALDHAIKEAMRMYPVSAFGTVRETHRDFRVDHATIIPKGSKVFIPTILLHRNAEYFDRPDEFLPDRWNAPQHPEGAFMPYSMGSRSCVGMSLAQVELRAVLARLLADYDFDIVEPGEPEMLFTLKPSGVLLKTRKL